MNSVANLMVATTMNSNFSAQQSTGRNSHKTNRQFSDVLDHVNTHKSERNAMSLRSQSPETDERMTVQGKRLQKQGETVREQVSAKDNHDEVKDQEITKTNTLADKVHEVTEKATEELTDMKSVLNTDEGKAIYDEAMTMISEMFGIPLEELQSVLQEVNVDLLDLSDSGNLSKVIQSVFGHDAIAEMLLDNEATDVFKQVHTELNKLYEALDLDINLLREQLRAASGQTQAPVEEAVKAPNGQSIDPMASTSETITPGKGSNLEVVDLRNDQNTSNDSQNKPGQNQNNQTFGEMMSQQITGMKEGVVNANFQQKDFQQISTKEVIDQIVTKAVLTLNNDKTSMQMQLNPEHLGKVAVTITAEQGIVKGQFVAENHVVKEMLETNMIQLKTQLEEQGIKVEKIEVVIGNASQFFNQKDHSEQNHEPSKQSQRRRSGRISQLMQIDDVNVTETDIQRKPKTTLVEHTVEYSA